MRAAEGKLLWLREEAIEADKQKDNKKHANMRSRRRKGRRLSKKNETADTADKGRKEREEAELIHHVESRLKDSSRAKLRWEKTVRDGKVKWVQHEVTEEEVRDKRRALLHEIYEKDPDYFDQAFDSSNEESLILQRPWQE